MAKSTKTTRKKSTTKVTSPVGEESVKVSTEPRLFSFNIMDDDCADIVESAAETLNTMRLKRKNRTAGFRSMIDVRKGMLPIPEFHVQRLIGGIGIPQASLVSLVGPEGIGKTTFVLQLIGWGMMAGCPGYYQETEEKPMDPSRMLRSLSRDPVTAVKMLSRIGTDSPRSLAESEELLEDWCVSMRGGVSKYGRKSYNVPMDTPLIAVIDTWSKLMSKTQAEGFYDYADNVGAGKKRKDTGEGSTFGHARFAQDWMRRMPYFLGKYNVILIVVEHQNDKVDVAAAGKGGGFTMSAETSAVYNKVKVGGRAINQNASLQLIMARLGLAKDGSGNTCGTMVRLRVDKNSYGPSNRIIEFELRNEHKHDTDDYLEPSLIFHDSMAKLFADEKYLGVTVSSKRYTCPALGVTGVTGEVFHAAFHANAEVMNDLGARLKIEGYNDIVERTLERIRKAEEEAATKAEEEKEKARQERAAKKVRKNDENSEGPEADQN